MPPGRAIAELLFGRSGPWNKLFKGSKPAVQRQAAKQQVTHIHTNVPVKAQVSAQAIQPSSNGGGRLVNAIVDVFSPLVRAPGVAARGSKAIEPVHKVVGRTANARAGYHTLAHSVRPKVGGGFGNVRPTAIPRSTNSMGLQSARNFSGSRTVFENVVHNAPLGLRVLGDKDRLDMSRFKREMRAAYVKKQKMEGKGKGKGRTFDPFTLVKATPSSFDAYFPKASVTTSELEKPSVQLILTLNPVNESTSFLSYTEEAEDSRFFSAMLLSDMRLLSEMHGVHQARLRQIIERLELAGCFETDAETGLILVKAGLDEVQGQIVITFFGDRWSMADVRQVLGLYEGRRETWFKLVDLREDDQSDDSSPMPSSIPSDMEESLSSFSPSRTPSLAGSFDDVEEHARVNASVFVPTLDTSSTVTESYLWGVHEFIDGLNGSQRPNFVSR